MSIVFACMNLKGGVGKTVLTANIARELVAREDKNILLIDLDPQCSLSYLFSDANEIANRNPDTTALAAVRPEGCDTVELLKQAKRIFTKTGRFRRTSNGKIDLIMGSMEIYKLIARAGANTQAIAKQNFGKFVREASAHYDYIMIDTNPSTNVASLCALEAAQYIIAPMKMDIFFSSRHSDAGGNFW